MTAETEALHVSKPTARSMGNEYRVYPDRIELDLKLFGLTTIPLQDVAAVAVRPPLVVGDLWRRAYGFGALARTVKLDLADLFTHVAIEKKSGIWRQFRVTPEDPEAFAEAFSRAKEAQGGGQP